MDIQGCAREGATGMKQDELAAQHLEPLWLNMDAMVPPTPNPVTVPHMWRYEHALPHLLKAGEMVPAEEAERRVLMLINPNMEAPHTTDTIYGGLQLVKPGETAPAHRHIAFAVRFIIEGEGFTAVEGKKLPIKRGDVVVTPTWHWHDHGNESDANIIWLDALNLPLFKFARVHFAEGYSESRYPSILCNDSEWNIPWSKVEPALDGDESPHAIYHYKGAAGGPLSTTLAVQAERIDGGHTTEESQEQCSFMYHCYSGDGQTAVNPPNGGVEIFTWTSRDTFVVPAWSKVQHHNTSEEKAYLVAITDRPLLDLLQLRRPSV